MAIVPSDLAQQWSTRFETLFLTEFNVNLSVSREQMSPILMNVPMGDHEGNQMQLDWLGAAPQMRQWVDEKRAAGLANYAWNVSVLDYEATIEINMNALLDAKFNPYEMRVREMAQNAARLQYNLISDLLINGHLQLCYDGQFFFDTDHSEGSSGTQSNYLNGTGTSVAQLTADYFAAYSALCGYKDDKGEVLASSPFRPLVWIPNTAAMIQGFKTLRSAQLISNTSNILTNDFDIIIDPRLTDTNDWMMFRTDGVMKPFILVDRQSPTYRDNFASQADSIFNNKTGKASVEARAAATYGMWQKAVRTVN